MAENSPSETLPGLGPIRQAETIDQVLEDLVKIIQWSEKYGSRVGYFAALYHHVTDAVKQGIEYKKFFDDNQRMEKLDVIFANRYLAALEAYRTGGKPTEVWEFAFKVNQQWWPIVLQQLLIGMNAHINLDLGIAAARVAPGDKLESLHNDFNKINKILASLVNIVKNELAQIWTILRFFNRYLGSVEDAIINFSMKLARDHAWSIAEKLAPLDKKEQEPLIAEIDKKALTISHLIRHPGFIGSLVTGLIRIGEKGSVSEKVRILDGLTPEIDFNSL